MTDMVVLAFDGENTADNVRDRLIELDKQYLLQLDSVAVVSRNSMGAVKIKDEPRLTRIGALGGAFWGLLIGVIFFVPLVGVAVGAASGAIAGHYMKNGISQEYMKQIEAAVQPGQSGILILADNVKMDRVVPMLQEFHPRVIRTSLTVDQEAKLKEAFGGSAPTPMTATTS
jgi:uncharacterized membrane protein